MNSKYYSKDLNHIKSTIMIIAASILWGIIGLFTRPLYSEGFTAIQLTAARCVISALFLLFFTLFFDKHKLDIRLRDTGYFIGTGIFSIIFFNICYFITIQLSTLSVASILLYTAPYFTVIISYFLFHEPLTRYKILSILLSFTGCVLIAGLDHMHSSTVQMLAVITGIGSGIGYSLFTILSHMILKKYSPITVNVYTFIFASICILPAANINSCINLIKGNHQILYNLLSLGIISTAIPFLLYTKGLQYMETGKASILAFIEPLVASLIGSAIFKETFTFKNLAGIFLIVISVLLLNIKFKDKYE
ncbi:EamA family transporter [Clostridium sp. AM58-1XD]|uniref:DMT family transporter n=1 Tax=Clostridium sp. AM58-1XD TaxID=2292307 RepID=UPI000E543AF5|nr:EamA family transporter [Clostridium sp. AM58-1XD]RGY97606.1 EamA family transporter [Clostridium sp. AM58-1XD]